MSSTGYVIAAYGAFVGMIGAYAGILVPRSRARRRALAALEAEGSDR